MEKSPNYREKSKMCEASAYSRERDISEMSELIQEVFWRGSLGARMHEAHRTLGWTRNRVREVFSGRARRIEAFEKEQLKALKAARIAHADFIAETERMAAIHLPQDPDFYRDQVEARRRVALGMDRARTDRAGGGDE